MLCQLAAIFIKASRSLAVYCLFTCNNKFTIIIIINYFHWLSKISISNSGIRDLKFLKPTIRATLICKTRTLWRLVKFFKTHLKIHWTSFATSIPHINKQCQQKVLRVFKTKGFKFSLSLSLLFLFFYYLMLCFFFFFDSFVDDFWQSTAILWYGCHINWFSISQTDRQFQPLLPFKKGGGAMEQGILK